MCSALLAMLFNAAIFDLPCVLVLGGRGVIEEIEKQLALTHDLMQPSKDTLHRRAPPPLFL